MVYECICHDYDSRPHQGVGDGLLVFFLKSHTFNYYGFGVFFSCQTEEGDHLKNTWVSLSLQFLDTSVAMDDLQTASAGSGHCFDSVALEAICNYSGDGGFAPCSIYKNSQRNFINIISVAAILGCSV